MILKILGWMLAVAGLALAAMSAAPGAALGRPWLFAAAGAWVVFAVVAAPPTRRFVPALRSGLLTGVMLVIAAVGAVLAAGMDRSTEGRLPAPTPASAPATALAQ